MQKRNAMLGKTHVGKWNGKKREKEGKEERKWVWGGRRQISPKPQETHS